MKDFVEPDSIVRRIWGNSDMILLVFAGCAAEFALNRAVDWLYFTGRLPRDPFGRLFSTAGYARQIVFAEAPDAAAALARIRAVHETVERQRGQRIPDWAHRDVLYMLIDYSERACELLGNRLTPAQQCDLYDVFHRVGTGLGIPELPRDYAAWKADRDIHLRRDLVRSDATEALYAQYRKHLGGTRYRLLLAVQSLLAPDYVLNLLQLKRASWLRPLTALYPLVVRAHLRPAIERSLIPARLLPQVRALDALAVAERALSGA
jgi:uncharacterized protein (DUF2236 family)